MLNLSRADLSGSTRNRGGQLQCVAELRRVKGELLLQTDANQNDAAAETRFTAALTIAAKQGALLWELRAALSLARLRVRQDRAYDARRILTSVYGRFTEGFGTADLRAPRALLNDRGSLPAPVASAPGNETCCIASNRLAFRLERGHGAFRPGHPPRESCGYQTRRRRRNRPPETLRQKGPRREGISGKPNRA